MRITLLASLLLLTSLTFGQGTGEVIITEYHNRLLKPTDEQLAAALPNIPAGADTSPNEGHTGLNVVSATKGPFSIELYDLVGKRAGQVQMSNNRIGVSQLPTGIYLLKLNFDEGSAAKRIVV